MARRLTVVLVCNRASCIATRQGTYDESIDRLRDRLGEIGWISDKALDIDLCPQHVEDIESYYEDAFK